VYKVLDAIVTQIVRVGAKAVGVEVANMTLVEPGERCVRLFRVLCFPSHQEQKVFVSLIVRVGV
jgi:hypothetical protein